MSRKVLILGALFVVGVVSFALGVITDPNLNWQSALLSLGSEGLKTAVLFVLIDYLIGDHERQKEQKETAAKDLDLLYGSGKATSERHLDDLETDGSISFNFTSDHSLEGKVFEKRRFENSQWEIANFSRTQFAQCEFDNLTISNLPFIGAIFEGVSFKKSILDRVDLTRCLFVDCSFHACDLSTSSCLETRFRNCEFFVMSTDKFPQRGAEYEGCRNVPKEVKK